MFRHKIREWRESRLIERTVLTYQSHAPPKQTDSLYVCLDIPTVAKPTEPTYEISEDTKRQIPLPIVQCINDVCQENRITPKIIDYVLEVKVVKKNNEARGVIWYDGAPVDQIVRFASIGTQVALEILDRLERFKNSWNRDFELADHVYSRLEDELELGYRWERDAFHFVCNSLGLPYHQEEYLEQLHFGIILCGGNQLLQSITANL